MKVYLYIDEADRKGFDFVTKKLMESHPTLEWEALTVETTSKDQWNSLLGCFRINCTTDDSLTSDLTWPSFTFISKNKAGKEKVLKDLKDSVIPAIAKNIPSTVNLNAGQMNKILGMISGATSKFTFDMPNGVTLVVGPDVQESGNGIRYISHADVASALAAMFIFNSKMVKIGD